MTIFNIKCFLYIQKINRIKNYLNKNVMDNMQEQWWSQAQVDENAVILDVRTEGEWNQGIIPGAINIEIYKEQSFIYKIEELDPSKNYYVYCRVGVRSAQACIIMNQLGIKNTYNLVGGIMEWQGELIDPNE